MAYTCNITRRSNGGYTVIWDGASSYPSEISYHGTETGVILFAKGFHMTRFYRPSEWTIDATGSYTTVTQVCDALDTMGVDAIDPLDSEKVSIATGDLPWNHFTSAAAVSTGQAVSSGWADFGDEIDVQGYKSLLVWTSLTHYASSNCRVKALAKHATSGADEYELPIKTVSTSDVKVNSLYYELDSDATQKMLLDFDITAVPYVQLQIQAGTVGTTGDVIAASITKMY